jgi:hypothetical protein
MFDLSLPLSRIETTRNRVTRLILTPGQIRYDNVTLSPLLRNPQFAFARWSKSGLRVTLSYLRANIQLTYT